MINFTFQKEISDVPMILPVEMFIVEEETAAPEFVEEINEIIPTMQEEVVEEEPNTIEEALQILWLKKLSLIQYCLSLKKLYKKYQSLRS
jgi:glycyl-tRNA synthetase (class II)